MSIGGIFSKYAATQEFFSPSFCLAYAGLLTTLIIYAIGWQQVIKKLSISFAYANKSIGVIYAMIWGMLFFDETISIGKIVGIIFIVCGVILFARAEGSHGDNNSYRNTTN